MLFFTSDQHYGHKNIIRHCARPFASVDEMDAELIARHNSVVSANDDVWHLGDFSMNVNVMSRVLPQLKGKHRLIVGNHDACHPCHGAKAERKRDLYANAGFIEIFDRLWIDLPMPIGKALLCHMPCVGTDPFDDRYSQHKPTFDELGDDAWLIHGHVHKTWRSKKQMLNMGVDVWDYRPVSFDELVEFVDKM